MYGMPGPVLDLGDAVLGRLDGQADGAAPALVPVVVAVEPVVGLPVVERDGHRVLRLGDPRRVGGRLQDRDVGAGLHDQLLERQIGVAAGELAVRREGVDAHRVGVRVVGCVVVDLVADLVRAEVLAAPRLRDVLAEFAAAGRRVDVGVDATHGDALGGRYPWIGCDGHGGLLATSTVPQLADGHDRTFDAVELRGVPPAQLVALFGAVRARHRQLVELPVRIARAVHHHVVLAGEAGPFAGELDITGSVEAALHEEHVAGQVVAGHLRRPRRLLQVWPAEAVHPPHERRQHVRGAVGPDELQVRASSRTRPRRSCSSGGRGSSAP